MLCAKCKAVKPIEGDSWCIGRSAWEAIGSELCASWHNKALRSVAGALVAQTITSIRALRNISSGLKSAEDAKASAASTPSRSQAPHRRERDPAPEEKPSGSRKKDVKEEEEASYEYETESEAQEEAPAATAKVDPTKKPPEPAHPPKGWAPREPIERRGYKRKERDDRKPLRRKTERGRRSGRKHQALYRTLDKPDLVVHRRRAGSYWDQEGAIAGVEPQEEPKNDDRRRK